MALLFVDGIDHYNTLALMQRKYNTVTGTPTFVTGRFGRGTAWSGPAGAQGLFSKTIASSVATLIAGMAFRWTATFSLTSITGILEFQDAGSAQVGVGIRGDGVLFAYRGTTSTVLGTATVRINFNQWNYLEFKSTINNTTGTIDIKLNGTNVLSLTSQNTRSTANNSANAVKWTQGGNNNQTMDIDDVYICDTSGSVNNDFLGEIEVKTQVPTSDSAVQFTRSTGANNWANVDDSAPNDDTDYNEDATVGHKDLFGMAAMAGNTPTTIKAVAVTSNWKNTDASARTGRNVLKSSATTSNGASIALGTSYSLQQDIFETDPNGAIAWTPTAVNAAIPGVEVVA